MPGVPPEVQRQAKEYAAELWNDIEGTAAGSDADPTQLRRIKPMVIQALEIAFGRGAFIFVKGGLAEIEKVAAELQKLAAKQKKARLN